VSRYLAALVALANSHSLPAGDPDPVVVGEWPGYATGRAQRVAVSDHYAYVVVGGGFTSSGLQVVDIADPARPQRVRVCESGAFESDVSVSGHYAYVTGAWPEGTLWRSGLRVLDVSHPANPWLVGKCANGDDGAECVLVSGAYAYVTGICWEGGVGFYSLQVFDVADPTEPKRVGLCRTGGHPATHLAASGHYAYLACGEGGLQVIDVSDPVNPQRLGSWSSGGSANWVAVSGNRAFLGEWAVSHGANDLRGGGLQIIDISDPARPQWVGACNRGESTRCVAVSGDRAYVGTSDAGLKVIDVSDPTNPHQIGGCDTQEASGIAVSGSYAYVADAYAGLQVIDVSNPVAPRQVGNCPTYQSAEGVAVSGDRAYLVEQVGAGSSGSERLQVLDVSNPASPRHVAEYDASGWDFGLPVSTNFTYFPDLEEAWLVTDVSDPANPRPVGGYRTIASVSGVVVADHHAYVPTQSQVGSNLVYGFQVIDISDPAQPRRVGDYYGASGIGWHMGIALYGHYVCATDAEGPDVGILLIVDVSDPTTPRQVGAYNLTGAATDVVVSGHYAYVTAYWGGLQVLDLSSPTQPELVGSVPISGAWKVTLFGRYAFVADRFKLAALHSLHIVDIADPAHPVRAGRYPMAVMGAAGSGRHVYVANGPGGLKVLDISRPAIPRRLGGYALSEGYGEILGLAVSGEYAYVAQEIWDEGRHQTQTRLAVLNVASPAHVRQVGAIDTPGSTWGFGLSGDYALIAGDELRVFDVSDRVNLRQVGQYAAVDRIRALAVSGHHVYAAVEWLQGSSWRAGVHVLEVSDPQLLRRVGAYAFDFESWETAYVAVNGNFACIAGTYWSGSQRRDCLQAIDISDPTQLRVAGRYEYEGTHSRCYGIAFAGRYACVAAANAGLLVLNLTDPANPSLVGSYTEHLAEGVVVSGDYAYLAVSPRQHNFDSQPGDYSGSGVEVIDISDPARPRRVGGNSADGGVMNTSSMVVAGDRVYFAGGPNLTILELCEPPQFEPLHLDADGFHLRLRGLTGQMMRLERSTDLLNWIPFVTVPIPAGGRTLIDPAATTEPFLFYRAVTVP
jgi:hypothetical protein